jgi:hypothetical protein
MQKIAAPGGGQSRIQGRRDHNQTPDPTLDCPIATSSTWHRNPKIGALCVPVGLAYGEGRELLSVAMAEQVLAASCPVGHSGRKVVAGKPDVRQVYCGPSPSERKPHELFCFVFSLNRYVRGAGVGLLEHLILRGLHQASINPHLAALS